MKKSVSAAISLILCLVLTLLLASCGKKTEPEQTPSDSSLYAGDTVLGEGEKTVTVIVTSGNETTNFTINTSAETVGDALIENKLAEGEKGPYGLYIKSINGITADYETDGYYWAFYINGEMAMTGVDGTPIEEGAEYSFVRTKG